MRTISSWERVYMCKPFPPWDAGVREGTEISGSTAYRRVRRRQAGCMGIIFAEAATCARRSICRLSRCCPGSFPVCVNPSVPDLVLACAHTVQVDQLNKDYAEKKISKTDLIQKKLNAVETHLG